MKLPNTRDALVLMLCLMVVFCVCLPVICRAWLTLATRVILPDSESYRQFMQGIIQFILGVLSGYVLKKSGAEDQPPPPPGT